MKRLLPLVLLVLSLALAAPAGAAQVNKVAAVVNGKLITMFDLQRNAVPELARAGLKPGNPKDQPAIDAVMRRVLDSMILDLLLQQEATRLSVKVTSAEVDQEITRMYQGRGMTREQFEAALAKEKLSLDEMRSNIRKDMLRQRIMNMEVRRRVVVTPEEIKAYYEEHKATMYNRQGLHMALIVYHPDAPAAQIAPKLKSGALNWLEVSKRYSVLPTRNEGGDNGEVQWERLNPEFRERLMRMQPGEVTDLFQYNAQLKAQIRLFRPRGDQSPLRLMTLEEATPEIDDILRGPKAQERFEEYTRQLREKAVIDIRM